MTTARVATIAFVVAAMLIVGTLFVLQNGERATQLSLDLGFRAWELQRPVTVPLLIAVCFTSGLVVAGVPLGLRSLRLQSKIRRLEQGRPPLNTGPMSPDGW